MYIPSIFTTWLRGCLLKHLFNDICRFHCTFCFIYNFLFISISVVGCNIHEKNIYADKQSILLILLNKKACTNAKSHHGDLPIHLALQMESVDNERHQKDILLLVTHSTGMNFPDKNGNTPIILASSFCSVAIIRKMIEIGADVNYKGHRGNAALHKHMGRFNVLYMVYYCMSIAF